MNEAPVSSGSGPVAELLVVSPTPTSPPDHGNRKRILETCRTLQDRGCRITFVHYASELDWRGRIPYEHDRAMRGQWEEYHLVLPSVPLHCPPRDGVDHHIDEWWDPALQRQLEFLVASRFYDAVWVNYTWLSRALTLFPRFTLKILDTHDKFSDRRLLLESLGVGPEFFHTSRAEEVRALDRADLVLAIKDEEKAYFDSVTRKPVATLPHYEAHAPARPPERLPSASLRLGVIGARNNVNQLNLRRFLEVFLPRRRQFMAPVEIVVAGGICDDFRADRMGDAVRFVGRVESVDDFYDQVDAVLIPMTLSSGQKIKTGEALSRGCALLSTAHGMEGYPARDRWHRASDIDELVSFCIRLAFERERLPELRQASLQAWAAQQDRAQQTYRAICEGIFAPVRRIVFHVDGDLVSRNEYLWLHLQQALLFATSLGSVTLRWRAEDTPRTRRLLAQLQPLARVVVVTDDPIDYAAVGVLRDSPARPLDQQPVHWIFDALAPGCIGAHPVFLLVPTCLPGVRQAIQGLPGPFRDLRRGVRYLAGRCVRDESGVRWCAAPKPVYAGPFGHETLDRVIAERPPTHDPHVEIWTSAALLPVARAVSVTLTRSRVEPEPDWIRIRLPDEAAGDARGGEAIRCEGGPVLFGAPQNLGPLPEVVLELSSLDGMSLHRGWLEANRVPIFSLEALASLERLPRLPALIAWFVQSMVDRAVRERLRDHQYPAERRDYVADTWSTLFSVLESELWLNAPIGESVR